MDEILAVQEECNSLSLLINAHFEHFPERIKEKIRGANDTTVFFMNRQEYYRVLYETRKLRQEILEYLGLD